MNRVCCQINFKYNQPLILEKRRSRFPAKRTAAQHNRRRNKKKERKKHRRVYIDCIHVGYKMCYRSRASNSPFFRIVLLRFKRQSNLFALYRLVSVDRCCKMNAKIKRSGLENVTPSYPFRVLSLFLLAPHFSLFLLFNSLSFFSLHIHLLPFASRTESVTFTIAALHYTSANLFRVDFATGLRFAKESMLTHSSRFPVIC